MKQLLYVWVLLLAAGRWGYAQESQEAYNRSSVSLILMDYKDGLQKSVYSVFSSLDAGDRYDKNKISTSLLLYEGNREYKTKDLLTGKEKITAPDRTQVLTQYLNAENVGLQVISFIYGRKTDGTLDETLVRERAAYNKTDDDYNSIQLKKVNGLTGLQQGGKELIKNCYFMIYDLANLRYEYIEDEKYPDFHWLATPVMYLYQVDWTDELQAELYNNCWLDADTPENERAEKRARYEALRVSVKLVMMRNMTQDVETGIVEFRKKSKAERGNKKEEDLKAEALEKIIKKGFDDLLEKVEKKNEAFRVKSYVSDVKPVRIKVGKKEGVKTDLRFYMYENCQDENGKEYKVRKGVVLATDKVTDNRQVTTGKTVPSEFYQIAGRAAQPGWEVIEKKAVGLNADLGYQMGNLSGVYFGLTGNFYGRKNFNHYFLVDFVYGLDKYDVDWYSKSSNEFLKSATYNLLVANIGYGYGFMKRNWRLYPYIGAGANMLLSSEKEDANVTEKEKDSKFMDETAWMFNFGVQGAYTVWYPLEAFATLEFSTALSKGKVYNAVTVHKDLDKATSGVHFRFGLRYSF